MTLRLSVFGNAFWTGTGYARQALTLLPRFQALGHAVSLQASWGLHGGLLAWPTPYGGIPVYPRVFDRYGQDTVLRHARHFRADLLLSLCDLPLFTLDNLRAIPVCPYFPVDHDPLPARIYERARLAFAPLVYSRFAERICREAGLDTVRYVTHPIDTALFTPGDRQQAREACGFPPQLRDRYLVGMVAMNKYTRKRFDVHLQAFKAFQQRHPDAALYLHTYAGEEMGGVDILALCESLELDVGRDVFLPPQYAMAAGLISEAELVQVYRSLDVLLLVSEGEGFGIPLLEAQACGIPVVTGDWTSMPELCFAGEIVPRSETQCVWDGKFDSWHWVARPGAIAEALDALYEHPDPDNAQAARAGALRFDAERVVREEWAPLLTELEQRLVDEGYRAA